MPKSFEARLDKLLSNYKEKKDLLCYFQYDKPAIPENFNGYIIWIKQYYEESKHPRA